MILQSIIEAGSATPPERARELLAFAERQIADAILVEGGLADRSPALEDIKLLPPSPIDAPLKAVSEQYIAALVQSGFPERAARLISDWVHIISTARGYQMLIAQQRAALISRDGETPE